MSLKFKKLLFASVFAATILLALTACSDNISEPIPDSSLPKNEFEDVLFRTSDGSNCLLIEQGSKSLEGILVLVNNSAFEVCIAKDIYYVRLQEFKNGEWVFADDNAYPGGSHNATALSIMPGSLYGELPLSLKIDVKSIDPDGIYRLYLPITYRSCTEGNASGDFMPACLVTEIKIKVF